MTVNQPRKILIQDGRHWLETTPKKQNDLIQYIYDPKITMVIKLRLLKSLI